MTRGTGEHLAQLLAALLWFLAAVRPSILFVALTAIVFFMHRGNIARLMAGTEPKIGKTKTPAPPGE